jgi:hypothetical protein
MDMPKEEMYPKGMSTLAIVAWVIVAAAVLVSLYLIGMALFPPAEVAVPMAAGGAVAAKKEKFHWGYNYGYSPYRRRRWYSSWRYPYSSYYYPYSSYYSSYYPYSSLSYPYYSYSSYPSYSSSYDYSYSYPSSSYYSSYY